MDGPNYLNLNKKQLSSKKKKKKKFKENSLSHYESKGFRKIGSSFLGIYIGFLISKRTPSYSKQWCVGRGRPSLSYIDDLCTDTGLNNIGEVARLMADWWWVAKKEC